MSPRRLIRPLFAVAAFASLCAVSSEVMAQTQQLDKTLVRKFPEDFCPLDTQLIGSFVTNTGHIQLTFATAGEASIAFNQILDDISIIEADEFAANSVEHESCFFDGPPYALVYQGSLTGNPKVPFYDAFGPSTSTCPWDETDGATISDGALHFVGTGEDVSTSVVISGLTPGVNYVIHGNWSANDFNPFEPACTGAALCLQVTVDDLPNGCGPLPVESKTWGGVKALYKN
jgi:hypothetical protein